MDPFSAFNQSAESNRGNYDPFVAFNKSTGVEQNLNNLQAERPDKNFPLVRVTIPGSRDILTRALQLDQSTGIPFQLSVHGNSLKVTPGIVAGYLPDNFLDPIPITQNNDCYVWVECQSAANNITSVSINHGSSFPIPQTISQAIAPTTLNIPIGMYVKNISYNLLSSNWLNPIPVIAFSNTESNGIVTNYYLWSW